MTLLFFYKMNTTDPQSGGSELKKSCLLFGLEELRICRILRIMAEYWNLAEFAEFLEFDCIIGTSAISEIEEFYRILVANNRIIEF